METAGASLLHSCGTIISGQGISLIYIVIVNKSLNLVMGKAQLKISLKIGLYHNNNILDYIFVVISYFSL